MRENVCKLMSKVTERGADAFLICSPVNRRYVTGFPTSDGFVIVKPDSVCFVTDFRYYEAACLARKNGVIDSEAELVLQEPRALAQLSELLSGCKKVLFEDKYVTVEYFSRLKKAFGGMELEGGSSVLEACRAQKTHKELDCIKRAQKITDAAFQYILGVISDNAGKVGFTERELALEVEFFMRKNGSDGVAFDTICVSGKSSSLPHGVPKDAPLQKGFLTMDFGARYDGYCSDMTRTVCLGTPDEEMKRVYDTVLAAQKKALETVYGGISGSQADASARELIDEAGYKGAFGHSLGHSLGLDIHESPCFSPSEKNSVPAGAVVSVEPGIYLEGKYGVRIEDIVFLTENGCQNLTESEKKLIII